MSEPVSHVLDRNRRWSGNPKLSIALFHNAVMRLAIQLEATIFHGNSPFDSDAQIA
jgi:hypothetical protein